MLDDFLKAATQIAAAGGPVLMVFAVWGFLTNRVVSAQTLKERDAMNALALADRDKQIVFLQQRYDEMQAIAFKLSDITKRTQDVKTTGFEHP